MAECSRDGVSFHVGERASVCHDSPPMSCSDGVPQTALPTGTTLFAEGGVPALGAMCAFLRSAGIDAALVRPPADCSTGCSPKVWLAVATPQLAEAARVLQEQKEQEERQLDEAGRAAAQIVDFDAAEATCPACGTAFATTSTRCPECGLNFGG